MKVMLTDSVGIHHEADASLMGLCSEGHDCYVVVVPFLIDGAHMPEVAIDELDTHIQFIGVMVNGDAYSTAPLVAVHAPIELPWTRRDRWGHRLSRYVAILAIIFAGFNLVLDVAMHRWVWVVVFSCLFTMLCMSTAKLDRQHKELGL